MKKPIFILGPHKSGTTLLRNLLDGSPELYVVPYEMHFFQHANEWVDYRLRKSKPPRASIEETKKAYYRSTKKNNRARGTMGGSDIDGKIDMECFREKMGKKVDSFKELVCLYVDASHKAILGHDKPKDVRVVEKSVEHAEFAIHLKTLFPDAKFLHILRNPYSNLVSLRRYLSRNRSNYPFLDPALSSLENNYYHLHHNSRILSDSYMIIKYEDLVLSTEEKMKEIAEFIEIQFSHKMLEPTTLGRSWKGNSSRGLRFSGVSKKNLEIWRKEISHLEVHLVNRLFSFILMKFGYDTLEPDRTFLWPVSKERPKNYLLNRLIPYYH